MVKILLMLIIAAASFELSASTNIECDYKTGNWNIVGNTYYCEVKNDLNIKTQESATITSISGNHQGEKTNADVDGFYIGSKTCHYFPRGLEAFYKNIKAIAVVGTKFKEIHQEDLKPFPKLVELQLFYNSLKVLENGLFDFNPDLEWISFQHNEIVHIEPNVFDHLSKLSSLDFDSNTCIDKKAQNSISEVKSLIQTVKSQCINSESSTQKVQITATKVETCSALESKIDNIVGILAAMEMRIDKKFEDQNQKLEQLSQRILRIMNGLYIYE